MHIILQLCYKILRSCEEIATIRTTVRFFLSKSPRNSLKYFFNHIIFYSFSFEFLLIIINFLLNKFSLIKTSSKTPFLINTASNLLHNSMPPLHRKRSPSPQGEAFDTQLIPHSSPWGELSTQLTVGWLSHIFYLPSLRRGRPMIAPTLLTTSPQRLFSHVKSGQP